MKKLYKLNLNSSYDGNISIKEKNRDYMLISPGGVAKYNLKKKMINKINIINTKTNTNKANTKTNTNNKANTKNNSNIEILEKEKENYYYSDTKIYFKREHNIYLPSGEIKIHTNIINSLSSKFDSQDICIIHCHPSNILAYTGLEKNNYRELNSLQNLFPELPNFINIAPNIEHITARTDKLANAIMNKFKGYNFITLQNHGVVCYSESFNKCIDMIMIIDYYCKCALDYYNSR